MGCKEEEREDGREERREEGREEGVPTRPLLLLLLLRRGPNSERTYDRQ